MYFCFSFRIFCSKCWFENKKFIAKRNGVKNSDLLSVKVAVNFKADILDDVLRVIEPYQIGDLHLSTTTRCPCGLKLILKPYGIILEKIPSDDRYVVEAKPNLLLKSKSCFGWMVDLYFGQNIFDLTVLIKMSK